LYYFTPLPEGKTLDPSQPDSPQPDVRIPECYTRVLETDLGIPVVGHCDVSTKALEAAEEIIRHMLKVRTLITLIPCQNLKTPKPLS